ncbi:MAG: DUF1311 domain-containing protein, partial [Verrucomicrobia bacterium]|nr:DUF1311 domain-containing protein [Verrucomicrobiota bacterium]
MKTTLIWIPGRAASLAVVAIVLSTGMLSAHDEKRHRIDAAMDAAQEADPSTGGQTEAIGKALKAWDKLLNASYQKLLGKLDNQADNQLRDSQREWVVWRDKELQNL